MLSSQNKVGTFFDIANKDFGDGTGDGCNTPTDEGSLEVTPHLEMSAHVQGFIVRRYLDLP
jgi:hypothetical protein